MEKVDIDEAVKWVLDNSSEEDLKDAIIDLLKDKDASIMRERKMYFVDGHFDSDFVELV
jgi:hypothetical protein